MVRASALVEGLGIPTSSVVCKGFAAQARASAAALLMPGLPLSVYPVVPNFDSVEALQNNVENVLINQIIAGLTVQPEEAKAPPPEPGPRDIVFTGTFEEVNRFFYEQEWSDGLPVVPPTAEKVEDFLKYTDRAPDEIIAELLPEKRCATIWNVAVNGVMAGCLPEYMPVLIAVVEAMADPIFGQRDLGHTPGSETLITLNGPIIHDLGFNYKQGALRVGFQANTSIGRFWRLYLRNVAGFLPHKTDKGTFGGTWRVVLAENEEACARIGWEPMSVDQGFKSGDNVVTVASCTSTDSVWHLASSRAEEILDVIARRIVDAQLYVFHVCYHGMRVRPQILLSPILAEAIARGGYTKERMRRYLYEHATFSARRYEQTGGKIVGPLCEAVRQGRLPKIYCESTDPERQAPIVWSPEDFLITVSGDPERDNCFICAQNGYIGYPVSKKIALPGNWNELIKR